MAERRMLSTKIVDTDEFIDMPVSTRLLYYELTLRADDDGFVSSPKKIIRMAGCSEDDLKILIVKQFILPFESGVVLIRDWKIHNRIRPDRYHETLFTEERGQVLLDPNERYIQCQTTGIPTVDAGKVRLGQDSLGQDSPGQDSLGQDSPGQDSLGQDSLGEKSDNGIVPDTAGNNRPLVSFPKNQEVSEAIKYFKQVYKTMRGEEHPSLKSNQFNKDFSVLSVFAKDNDLNYQSLVDLIDTYFQNDVLKCDKNLNHFCTEGILTHRMFEAGLS